ncbi:MGMT family protein [Zhihengliuella sp.]|uniref:MGMT family protein n=1 Tax=Zhihengliuella sp. TaxID=1954483 RepID=UPI002811AB47|nr:MGMT family protein [Zhihengliuella sp.]
MHSPLNLAIYEVVACIPAGSAVSYGDVAELLGAGGPRQVGAAMAGSAGEDLPWWRVVRADGSLPRELAERARPHWVSESTPVRGSGPDRVRFPDARWRPSVDEFARIDAIAALLHRGEDRSGGDP